MHAASEFQVLLVVRGVRGKQRVVRGDRFVEDVGVAMMAVDEVTRQRTRGTRPRVNL